MIDYFKLTREQQGNLRDQFRVFLNKNGWYYRYITVMVKRDSSFPWLSWREKVHNHEVPIENWINSSGLVIWGSDYGDWIELNRKWRDILKEASKHG